MSKKEIVQACLDEVFEFHRVLYNDNIINHDEIDRTAYLFDTIMNTMNSTIDTLIYNCEMRKDREIREHQFGDGKDCHIYKAQAYNEDIEDLKKEWC